MSILPPLAALASPSRLAPGDIWLLLIFGWLASMPIWGFSYAAYKFRHCGGWFWLYLTRAFLLLALYLSFAVSYLFPSEFGSHAMNWVSTTIFLALAVTGFLTGWLARQTAKNPDEAERRRQAVEDLFR